jgi:integral membrane protein
MKKLFRLIGWMEALSFLALLGIAMPMKYFYEMPTATKVPGMVHGLLFMAYIVLASQVAQKDQWSKKQLWVAYLASILPLGTLLFDYKYFRSADPELI